MLAMNWFSEESERSVNAAGLVGAEPDSREGRLLRSVDVVEVEAWRTRRRRGACEAGDSAEGANWEKVERYGTLARRFMVCRAGTIVSTRELGVALVRLGIATNPNGGSEVLRVLGSCKYELENVPKGMPDTPN